MTPHSSTAPCKPTAVLASNTSTLAIDSIADAVADPARVVGTCVEINQCVGCTRQFFTKSFLGATIQHERAVKFDFHTGRHALFSPANVMKLLENVRGALDGRRRRRGGDGARQAAPEDDGAGRRRLRLHRQPHARAVRPRVPGAPAAPRRRYFQDADSALRDFGMAMRLLLRRCAHDRVATMRPFRPRRLLRDIGHAVRTSLGLTDAAARDPAVEYSADVADALVEAGRLGQKAGGWA